MRGISKKKAMKQKAARLKLRAAAIESQTGPARYYRDTNFDIPSAKSKGNASASMPTSYIKKVLVK